MTPLKNALSSVVVACLLSSCATDAAPVPTGSVAPADETSDSTSTTTPSSDQASAAARMGCVAAIRDSNESQYRARALAAGKPEDFASAEAAFVMGHLEATFGKLCDCTADGAGGWAALAKHPELAQRPDPATQACAQKVMEQLGQAMPAKEAMTAFRAEWNAAHAPTPTP